MRSICAKIKYQVQPAILHELRHDFLTAEDGRIASLPLEVDAQIIKGVVAHPRSIGVLGNLSLRRFVDAIKLLFAAQVV